MESYVARTFDMDFVYLDIAFCAVWMLVLLRRRQTVALWFGLFGALVVFLVDDVLWLRVQHTRFLDVPLNRDLFLLYFSFTYGMIEFSYVTVMFGARSARTAVLWTRPAIRGMDGHRPDQPERRPRRPHHQTSAATCRTAGSCRRPWWPAGTCCWWY